MGLSIEARSAISRELLVGARQEIVDHGWNQGSLGNNGTGYCVVGALLKAWNARARQDVTDQDSDLWNETLDRIELALGEEVKSIGKWNDDPMRTKAQVLELFDRVIAEVGR